jgi:hypothetical protein
MCNSSHRLVDVANELWRILLFADICNPLCEPAINVRFINDPLLFARV